VGKEGLFKDFKKLIDNKIRIENVCFCGNHHLTNKSAYGHWWVEATDLASRRTSCKARFCSTKLIASVTIDADCRNGEYELL
jgi:hypothetical protein